MTYTFRQLKVSEAEQMFDLIVQCIRWMDKQGIHQWNDNHYDAAYPLETKMEACENGTAYGLFDADNKLACAAILPEEDEYWPEDDIKALYVHSFVSNEAYPGAGAEFLRCAEALARKMKKEYLRLDSQTDNEKLARYYMSQGFVSVGECEDGPYCGTLRQKKL